MFFIELADQVDQLLKRSCQAVQAPYDQSVAASHVVQSSVQSAAFILRSAGHVVKDSLAAGFCQFISLQTEVLIAG